MAPFGLNPDCGGLVIRPTQRLILIALAFAGGLCLASLGEAGTSSLVLGDLSLAPPGGASASARGRVARGSLVPGEEVLLEAPLRHDASGSFEVSWGVELTPAGGGSPQSLGSGAGWRVGSHSDQVLAIGQRIPAGISWGRYLLELNVVAGSDRLTTSRFVYLGEAADLELSDLEITTHASGATLTAGEVVGVEVEVSNRGQRPAGWSALDIRFSRNDAITAYDPAGGEIRLAPLSAGESRREHFDLVIPADLVGSYFLGARVDADREVDELVEGGTARTPVRHPLRSDSALPDLEAVSLMFSARSAAPGSYLSVDRTIRNRGRSATGSLDYALVISNNGVLNSTDRELWRGTLASLAAGEESTASLRVRIPGDLRPGSFRLGLRVDPDNTLQESSEDNNAAVAAGTLELQASGPLPDLQVTSLRPETYTTRPGDSLEVERVLENTGARADAFSYTLVLSSDSRIDSRDEVIYSYRYYQGLDAGSRRTGSVTATIPTDVRPGHYYVGLRLDPDQEVAESSEANHNFAAPFAIRVDRGQSVRRYDPQSVYMNDGDTLRVEGQSYRLLGYDTPEKNSGAFRGNQEPHASQATAHARGLLYDANELALHVGETDQYGRTLAHAFLDGRSLAVLMIEAEQAYETIRIFGNGGFYELGGEIIDAARGRSPPFQAPYRWRQSHKR